MSTNNDLKAARRAQGLCVYCGRPAVVKADGTTSRRCIECSASHVKQKWYARNGINTHGRITGRPRSKIESKWPEQAVCPECKIRTNADYWFCPWCGAELEPRS